VQIKYCLPLVCDRAQEVRDLIAQHEHEYTFFEVWLDYLDEVSEDFLRHVAEQYPDRVLFLFRRQYLDSLHMPPERRHALLHELAQLPAYVDLDLSQKEELEFVRSSPTKTQLIGSYHNYHETPSDDELQSLSIEMLSYGPDILKISTFCKTPDDAIRLLQLQSSFKQQGLRHIVLGMGPEGAVTRIFGTMWGNEFVFAPLSSEGATAAEQLTRDQLDQVFHTLHT